MSITYVGAISMLLGYLAKVFGVPAVDDETLKNTIAGIFALVGFIVNCYGRWRLGGVSWLGARV